MLLYAPRRRYHTMCFIFIPGLAWPLTPAVRVHGLCGHRNSPTLTECSLNCSVPPPRQLLPVGLALSSHPDGRHVSLSHIPSESASDTAYVNLYPPVGDVMLQ
ncbi:hypothetical protein B0H17DRAFT_1071566 [Mycena rosella]|uniref:Secreted protein n=1 Tax=Mycena rosella TaxID=1033263 RepID=A0AAD7DAK9_MYCRO|nr:hypothetical protein B0H17DRAFT_1071566 [Mycena rosella]